MTHMAFDISKQGIKVSTIHRNPSPAPLYEFALQEKTNTRSCAIASSGALISYSGAKTGRSPRDKRIVREASTEKDIHWGKVNIPLSEESFDINLDIALNYLNSRDELYVIDGYAGWSPQTRIKCRVICARPYHALFMHNMLIRPTAQELENFGEPEWVIYNAGAFPASPHVAGVSSEASICLNFKKRQFLILGTEYAGCMKKGVFTILNYLLPREGILSMHAAANEGPKGDTALFFGLSGTGKTTLSADPNRRLIGDDEHGWNEQGLFNFEGGCYAKAINLKQEREPEIWDAIRFGSVLENVIYDAKTHEVNFDDISITENTRASYPIEFVKSAKIPCLGTHPKNILFLTCDAYGVLPPISRLTEAQAMYHFISGYTAKVAGTEDGVKDPEATFSACFGAAFMVWHPMKYAELLKEKILHHKTNVWLVNTGWTGGGFGVGHRMPLAETRALVNAALSGALEKVDYVTDSIFGLRVPVECPGVSKTVLMPSKAWANEKDYQQAAQKLAKLFNTNFEQYKSGVSEEVLQAAPRVL